MDAELINEQLSQPKTINIVPKIAKFSEKIYSLDWSQHFPKDFLSRDKEKISIALISYEQALEFTKLNAAEIYDKNENESLRFLGSTGSQQLYKKYYYECGDFFGFYLNSKLMGFFVGTPIDWSSYYFRNCTLAKQIQNQGVYTQLLSYMMDILRNHGIERVLGDVSPSNLSHIHILNKLEFNVTGMNLSERWGAQLQFTKHLSQKHESTFLSHFCDGVKPQLRKRQQTMDVATLDQQNTI